MFKSWCELAEEFELSLSDYDMRLLHLTEALAKRWEGRQIVMLVDEIKYKDMLSKLADQTFSESVRMILVRTPRTSDSPLILPASFLHVTLTTPYRSTIAITRLAHFIAKCKGRVVPEGDFGSDVEGIKPIFFDVGKDKRKMEEALEHCRKHLGDNATILYNLDLPISIKKMVKEQGKEEEGPWDWYNSNNFYGWEAESVVAVTHGLDIMELITRVRTRLAVILVKAGPGIKIYFQKAAEMGLVEMVQLNLEAVEVSEQADEGEEEIEDKTVKAVEEKMEEKISCMSGCCTS